MTRARRVIRKRWTAGTEVLDSEIEETLLMGRGVLGTAIELRTLEDWRRVWARWRETIMPKVLEHRPGTRPLACYVCGEIPARPVVIEPPMEHRYFKLYVPSANGTGTWHFAYPEPYMQDEANYLDGLGVIDNVELKRHRAWRRKGYGPYKGPWDLDGYTLERGLYV